MTTHATGMLIDAVIQLDQPINLPNRTRVNLSIEPLDESVCGSKSAFESFNKLIDEHPIRSGGRHYTRDELHERPTEQSRATLTAHGNVNWMP